MLRRTAVALVAAIGLALTLSGTASAHPLGNFTTNHHAEVVLSGDRAFVHYVLDLAEIRTFQERDRVEALGRGRYAAELSSTIADGLTVRVDGVRRALAAFRHRLTFPEGAAGLRTTRFEVVLDGGALTTGEEHTVTIRDEVFAGRLGWREIVVRAERGARLASSTAPARSVSDRLRSYPDDFLSSPLDVRAASARFTPGDDGVAPALGRSVAFPRASEAAVEDGFAALIEDRDLTLGAVLVSLLVAAFWGAAHALTPGHGKALVAGYLVGTRGRPRHAFVLGATVTVTHTAGVFALGLVTLLLSQFLVPEQLYPWLTLVSGLLVVGVGAGVLRSRLRGRHHGHSHDGSGHHHVPRARPPPPRPSRTTTTTAAHVARAPRGGDRGRAASLPVGARRPAERDRPPPGRLRARADRRVQRRARRHDHGDRARCGARAARLLESAIRRAGDPRAPRGQRARDPGRRRGDHRPGDPRHHLSSDRTARPLPANHTRHRPTTERSNEDVRHGRVDRRTVGGSV